VTRAYTGMVCPPTLLMCMQRSYSRVWTCHEAWYQPC